MITEIKLPKEYPFMTPMFSEHKGITRRVRNGLENVLSTYVDLAKIQAKELDNNPENYTIDDVFIVGSGARENRIDSDMDLLLIAPYLDEINAKQLRVMLSYTFFTDRPKVEAIDVFVRNRDIYPERKSVNIISQVKNIVNKYNNILKK